MLPHPQLESQIKTSFDIIHISGMSYNIKFFHLDFPGLDRTFPLSLDSKSEFSGSAAGNNSTIKSEKCKN